MEQRTGRPVQFMRDDSLKVMATLQKARNGASFHVLRYRPTDEHLDYLIAHQAAFVLRLFENPPDQRFDFAPDEAKTATLMRALIPAGRPLTATDAATLPEFAKFTGQWAMMNMLSVPVGMRVDEWIDTTLPDLKDLQRANLAVQQQENVRIISHRVGGLSVPRVLLSVLAAYAQFVDRLSGTSGFSVPYRAAGLQALGAELLKAWDEVDHSPTHDVELIDRWASLCGLAGHYSWVPFKP
ncbi:MAG: hypothetical protein V4795_02705 [Pseudomonadota bacterium]